MPPSSTSRMFPFESKTIPRESACGPVLLAVPPPVGPLAFELVRCVNWLPDASDASTRNDRPENVGAPSELGNCGVALQVPLVGGSLLAGCRSPDTYTIL